MLTGQIAFFDNLSTPAHLTAFYPPTEKRLRAGGQHKPALPAHVEGTKAKKL
jgi:hypothetical protein